MFLDGKYIGDDTVILNPRSDEYRACTRYAIFSRDDDLTYIDSFKTSFKLDLIQNVQFDNTNDKFKLSISAYNNSKTEFTYESDIEFVNGKIYAYHRPNNLHIPNPYAVIVTSDDEFLKINSTDNIITIKYNKKYERIKLYVNEILLFVYTNEKRIDSIHLVLEIQPQSLNLSLKLTLLEDICTYDFL